jgi:hypothetical protein
VTLVEEMWALVPAVYRRHDADAPQSGALQALIQILGEQAQIVEDDIARLYDDWFIETCEPWVVDYIGDLIGVRQLHQVGPRTRLPRAYVANTLGYRRRKGTAAVLEQLARDVTGWPAHVIEGFTIVGTTQHLNHLRPGRLHGVSLHDNAALERIDSPFDRSARTVDVRLPPVGISNLPDIGLAVWRLEPFRLARVTARAVTDPPDGRYHFDPLGLDLPLANPPQPEATITSLATEQHVPGRLHRRVLFDELEGLRSGTVDVPVFFGTDPVVRVFADTGAGMDEIVPGELTAADLSDPPATVSTGWRRPAAPITAAFDPVLGRLAFAEGIVPSAVEVDYTYLAAGQVGAGPYDRSGSATSQVLARATWWRAVGHGLAADPHVTSSLSDAVQQWGSEPAGTVGVIVVLDSRTYTGDLAIAVPAGSELLVAGGSWPQVSEPEVGVVAAPSQIALEVARPHVLGTVTITGGPPSDGSLPPGRVLLDGLLVKGALVTSGELDDVQLLHCTIAPTAAVTMAGDADLSLVIGQSIVGPMTVTGPGATMAVTQSIVDGDVAAPDVEVDLDQVTILGGLAARSLQASDCVITGAAVVERKQVGCVRFSYLGDDSLTPRRYRCQPDLALDPPVGTADPVAVRARVRPIFDSDRFGDPDFAQLADRCAVELTNGSSTRSDMGAFAVLQRTQREANLGVALDEYLRFGLVAGLIHAS